MKKLFFYLLVLVAINPLLAQEKRVKFIIETPYGNMKGELYNETPLHRDNFVKLVKEGWYTDSPFHRIIKNFMIQGGQNKDGRKDPGYTIPPEFIPEKFVHKKGALAAARMPDQVNPRKESSGSQFYIIQGQPFDDKLLDNFEIRVNQQKQMDKITEFIMRPENKDIFDKVVAMQKAQKHAELNEFTGQVIQLMESQGIKMDKFAYTPAQREMYRNTGGSPHLDGAYTVFGEITEGFDVIDKLAAVPTKAGDVPVDEIDMKIRIIEE